MNLRNKTVLVVDSGLFLHVAVKLSESFGQTRLFVPWRGNGFPSEKQRQIGTGIEGVERVFSLWMAAREADLIVFTDVLWHDEIEQLRLMGKPVWGSGYADALEVERWKTKQLMQEIGMDVIPYELLIGGDALKEYLVDKDDCWIKASVTRGDFETMHWKGEHLSGRDLDKRLTSMGPRAKTKEFIVEISVPGREFGYDGSCIDGKFGRVALYGPEDKDAGYCGKVVQFNELPEPIRNPTLQMASVMGELGCRGFYSNEIRIADDGTPYLIDPTLRCGSPPSESYIELFSNWAEVIWAGAHGEVVDLEPQARYAAQIVLKSDWVEEDYLPVYFPEEIARWVKFHNYCVLDGQVTVTPQKFPEFGSVIGIGDSKGEAQEAAKSHAEQIEATDIQWKENVWEAIDKVIDEGRAAGVDF